MARLVKHDRQGPYKIEKGGEAIWICGCGLSRNKPFCDATHKITRDEKAGGLYVYGPDGQRVEFPIEYALKAPGEY